MLTDCVVLDIFLILSLFLATLYLWMKRKHSYWQRRGIRSLPGHWLFGHFKDAILMRMSPGMTLGKIYKQGSDEDDVLGIYILHKPFLLLRNPELIKQVFIRDFHIFTNHHFTAQSNSDKVGSSNLFVIHNPKWKYLRTKMSPVFTSGKLKALFLLMGDSADAMREHLREKFTNDKTVASILVKDMFYKYTTNVISSLAFGIQINCFDDPAPEFYKCSYKAFQPSVIRSLQFFALFFFPPIGKYVGGRMLGNYTDYFRKIFWLSMDNRKITKTKREDLIDSLLKLKDEYKPDDAFQFEGDALLAQSAIFFIAGRETTITTMTYALCELAKQPEIQKRLRKEILEKIQAADSITYEVVQDMKYLQQVISETLRLYPPAPILDRVASQDYTFPGTNITIEKGTPLYVALYGLHSDPRYHPDPMRFDPERFNDERKNKIIPCSYMPFGEGPRNCIGMRLGILQTAIGLITILRDYEVALNPAWKCIVDRKNVFITPPVGFMLDLKKI